MLQFTALNSAPEVIVKAYDELADFCFKNYKRGDFIFISGRLSDENEVEIEFCEKM